MDPWVKPWVLFYRCFLGQKNPPPRWGIEKWLFYNYSYFIRNIKEFVYIIFCNQNAVNGTIVQHDSAVAVTIQIIIVATIGVVVGILIEFTVVISESCVCRDSLRSIICPLRGKCAVVKFSRRKTTVTIIFFLSNTKNAPKNNSAYVLFSPMSI